MHVCIDEDTHLSLHPEGCVIGSVPLKKRTVEVDYDLNPDRSGKVRKNLAVHVSLSSIFTISKS